MHKKLIKGIKENISLKEYTTFKIGGKARYFFVAKDNGDFMSVISWALENNIPFFILGGGSNLLISDKGFKGLVIKAGNNAIELKKEKIIAQAGVKLSAASAMAKNNNLSGLEWSVGIPGTIGGAVLGNAGAAGKGMNDLIEKVEVFDIKDNKIKIFNNKKCGFGYRESIFKKNKKLIILAAELKFKKENKKNISRLEKSFLDDRLSRQPLDFPSAGSVFKNPKNFSAGEVIEKCGLKGKKIGRAKISEKHANFIINSGNAKAKDVISLIDIAKKAVKNKFKINLQEEIEFFGWKK
jgi:UDP-N-acetylmuramate dehydrogenase